MPVSVNLEHPQPQTVSYCSCTHRKHSAFVATGTPGDEVKKEEKKEEKAAKAKAAEAKKPAAKKEAKQAAPKKEAASKQQAKGGGLVVKKAESVPDWYAEVIGKGQLIEKYPVKGCFILRPWAYKLWEQIQGWLDTQIKILGVENCYFPMFIPKCYMEKESDHLDDFAPELAMVTKFGNEEIDEPVAIRPTSETAMYAAFSTWVQSHRDLPLKLNQWCSVVRWEVKQTTPFLRTREFLWQEGHTAYAEKADAEKEVLDILELYARVYEELLAIPVVRGTKTKAETFPGADYTTTVEAFIPATGRAIQGATSHHLGQNFSKMFNIAFQDPKDPTGSAVEHAYQNSWGLTQRTIGVMVMVHGDDKGLVLPPSVAGYQVVIVPLGIKASSTEEDKKSLADVSQSYTKRLRAAGVRVFLDDDNTNSPGWKFNNWEMKGVPLRMELGPLDIQKGEFVLAKRNILDQKAGKVIGKHDSLEDDVKRTLDDIHNELYSKALAERDSRLSTISEWKDFSPNLNEGKMVMVPFCGVKECEEGIKDKSKEEAAEVEVAGGLKMGAKSLCVPLELGLHASRAAAEPGMAWPTEGHVRHSRLCLVLWCLSLISIAQTSQPSSKCADGTCPKGRKDSGVLLMQLKPKLRRAESNTTDQDEKWPSCCSRCGSRGWCSPLSGKCHALQNKLYYEPCEAHPADAVTVGALDWSDEFEGAEIDSSSWVLLEAEGAVPSVKYTSRRDNAFVQNGSLKIVAKCEDLGRWNFSSARLTTASLREWGPGHRIELRARAPAGRGAWPAVWMLPSQGHHGTGHGGEIDIMETTGCISDKVQAAVQTGAFNADNKLQKGHHFYTTVSNWHVYTLDWLPRRLKWYVDGVSFFSFMPDSFSTAEWPFNKSFFLNLDVSVAGPWAGFCLDGHSPSCTKDEEFGRDQVLEVDYVRVYRLDEAHG
ncbi:Eprs1 [Symbiodinium sp. CCMP2592]|nr:Eprs1 [Symbiodinium sp. CCMP2592]